MPQTPVDDLQHPLRLPVDRLRRTCNPATLRFSTTAELDPFEGLIGQGRALEALDIGARIEKPGYNIFVLGERGTARHGTVRGLIERYASKQRAPQDWVYVANFDEPDRPNAIPLPPGRAVSLRTAMDHAIGELQSIIPALFESDDYQSRRRKAIAEVNATQEAAFEMLNEKARAEGITLIRTQGGISLAPFSGDDVMKPEEFNALPDEKRQQIGGLMEKYQARLATLVERLPAWERERRQRVLALDGEFASRAVQEVMRDVAGSFSDLPEVVAYIETATRELVANASLFRGPGSMRPDESPIAGTSVEQSVGLDPRIRQFRVNVVVGDGTSGTAPVIVEDNPSLGNLVGRIEQRAQMGALFTDFTLIRPGSLHMANGGFLLIDARRLLLEPYAWEMLKRCLRARAVTIETPMDRASVMSTQTIKPEPIPLATKVILFGDRQLYYSLFEADPDFAELFKIAVDFEETVEWNDATVSDYARLIGSIARHENLRPLSAAAVARVIEELGRDAEDASKLSLRIGLLADQLREADFWAAEAGHATIDTGDVERAIGAWERRHERSRLRAQELIERNIMLIDTAGAKIGQINGLSVMTLGGFSFGRPTRITAGVRMGTGEVLDIEREVDLGGPLHSKGVLILSSFLAARFVPDRPLSLSASLVFEQSYGGIDGDSASSTELYALLSELAGAPIRQGIAVTGSVNQRGEIQAIGGVNEKIEGFFDLCASRGLDGRQGVLIPRANVQHLMLRQRVVDAVAAGRFHVFSAATIDEGLSLLTGEIAGERGPDGLFSEGTLNRRVEDRLVAFSETRRLYADGADADEEE